MSIEIHSQAIVSKNAKIGNGVSIAPFSIVEDNVEIGDGTKIHSNVYIANGTIIGNNCEIFHGAVLGNKPQDLKFEGEKTSVEIGNETVIREYVTIHRGTTVRMKTTVGNNCFIMAYVHIAHDCEIKNNVILANAVNLAGHIVIEDFVIIGGMTPIHQFTKIGKHSMIGGGFRVSKDVPPFILAGGEPLSFQKINIVGLKRRDFTSQTISNIEETYRTIYKSNLNISQAVEQLETNKNLDLESRYIIEFIKSSKRGLISSNRTR